MITTFNMFLDTDSPLYANMEQLARNIVGNYVVNNVLQSANNPGFDVDLACWKLIVSKRQDLMPICKDNTTGKLHTRFTTNSTVIGIASKYEDLTNLSEKIDKLDHIENIFELNRLKSNAANLLESDLSNEGIANKTGVPLEFITKIRKLDYPTLYELPIAVMRQMELPIYSS